jgi:uncharacterized membrane protein YkvA (DUF1232 family)
MGESVIDLLKSQVAIKLVYQNNLPELTQSEEDAEQLFEAILNIPLILGELVNLVKSACLSDEQSVLATAVVSYICTPIDIIPNDIAGLLGFLDDSYVLYDNLLLILAENDFEKFAFNKAQVVNWGNISLRTIPEELRDSMKKASLSMKNKALQS